MYRNASVIIVNILLLDRVLLFCHRVTVQYNISFTCPGATEPDRQGVAEAARAGALLAHRQVHAGEGHDRVQGLRHARGGRRHRRRYQRRTGAQKG